MAPPSLLRDVSSRHTVDVNPAAASFQPVARSERVLFQFFGHICTKRSSREACGPMGALGPLGCSASSVQLARLPHVSTPPRFGLGLGARSRPTSDDSNVGWAVRARGTATLSSTRTRLPQSTEPWGHIFLISLPRADWWSREGATMLCSTTACRTFHDPSFEKSPLSAGFDVLQVPRGQHPGRLVVCYHLWVHHKLRREPE